VRTAESSVRRPAWGSVACAFAFAVLVVAVLVAHRHAVGPDAALHRWCVGHRTSAVTAVARALTSSAPSISYLIVAAAAVAAAMGAALRTAGRRGVLAGIVLTVAAAGALGVGQFVRFLLVNAIARARPPVSDWATSAGGHSFPSGHATTSALAAGITSVLVLRRCGTRTADRSRATTLSAAVRVAVVTVVLVWAVVVGLTRIYLGVHWPTDVLGGWLLAGALILAAAAALQGADRRHRRHCRATSPAIPTA
jgi:PAP2 superfamily